MATSAKIIKTKIEINAPKERVWEVLTNEEYYLQWYAEFGQGAYAKTTWQEGAPVHFLDASNHGMAGVIEVNRPAEELIIRFEGIVMDGQIDYDSPQAKEIKNTYESYMLEEENGITTLRTASAMNEEYFEAMSASWDRAKEKIKQLAEQ